MPFHFQQKLLTEGIWKRVRRRGLDVVAAIALANDFLVTTEHIKTLRYLLQSLRHHALMRAMEDIPDVKPTVARQVNCAATDASNRHADVAELILTAGAYWGSKSSVLLGQ